MVMPVSGIRAFLASQEALLVHFSTQMARNPTVCFPKDIATAVVLAGAAISFSTIQKGDTNPFMLGGRGGAEGCVGLIIDLLNHSTVLTVAPNDSGTYWDPATKEWHSGGLPPDSQTIADSIALRTGSNEWFIRDYIPIGIFVLPPIYVRQPMTALGVQTFGELEIQHTDVAVAFPEMRLFTANTTTFLEFDRLTSNWKAVAYADIIRP